MVRYSLGSLFKLCILNSLFVFLCVAFLFCLGVTLRLRKISMSFFRILSSVPLFSLIVPGYALLFSVQLWSSSNYHWSLKQTLNFDSFNDCIATLDWDLEQACCLRLMTTGGHYLQYTWTWTVNRSVGQMCSDPVGVFVIDGCEYLL